MRRLIALLPLGLLALAGCGQGPELSREAPPAPLANRDTPVAVGAEAPAFAARPAGKTFVVFYRGHW